MFCLLANAGDSKWSPIGPDAVQWTESVLDTNDWSRVFSFGRDIARSAIRLPLDGYLLGGSVSHRLGKQDWLLMRISSNGTILWKRLLGTAANDSLRAMVRSQDGKSVIVGSTYTKMNSWDVYLVQVDDQGFITWQRRYGSDGLSEEAHAIANMQDGGFVVTGQVVRKLQYSPWIFRTDSKGNVLWIKHIDLHLNEYAKFALATNTDSIYLAGFEFEVYRLDTTGHLIWAKKFGAPGFDGRLRSIAALPNNAIAILGVGPLGCYLMKVNSAGRILWQKLITTGLPVPFSERTPLVVPTADSRFLVIGNSLSNASKKDIWVAKLSPSGNVQWQHTYGGLKNDESADAVQAADHGYLVLNTTASFGDILGNFWALKLDSTGRFASCPGLNRDPVNISVTSSTLEATTISRIIEDFPGISTTTGHFSLRTPVLKTTTACQPQQQ